MTLLDWLIVFVLNGAVILYGFYLARGTETSSEWFLGARALPWWVIGFSMFATNVDNADLVSVTGNTFNEGLHIISVYAIGSVLGGVLAAFLVVPSIYRMGFYTNAEYLEARFGPAARAASAVIQLQYRSSMLGLMTWSVYLLLTRLVNLSSSMAWTLIILMVVLAGFYTAWGGLKSVVWTDVCQGLIILAASAVIFVAIWQAVGGWSGMNASLRELGESQGRPLEDLPHVGRFHGDTGYTSPLLVVLGWSIIGSGYWTVNHTQTMRLMGARSLWDMKMAAVAGVGLSMPVMVACACMGVFARALDLPEFQTMKTADEVYPILANRFLAPGWKGLVVAGVAAAAVSTFDSMGSALSAIFTRDIYARFLVRDREDAHYVLVGRIATVGILTLGFLYLPFILRQQSMIRAFTTLIPVFVTPLFTMYVLGVATRVHHRSGLIGLAAGSLYGVLALVDREFIDLAWMPDWLSERWMALSVSLIVTAVTMGLVTAVLGRQSAESTVVAFAEQGWLQRSREALPPLLESPFATAPPVWLRPVGWAAVLMAVSLWVVFGLFW